MDVPMIFGIDVGTRTTVVSYWNLRQRKRAELKLGTDERIPSYYRRGDTEIPQAQDELPALPADAVTDFKIRFWKTDQPGPENEQDLQGWLARLYGTLHREFGADMDRAGFCFTYPAQRNGLEPVYRRLIEQSGFGRERLLFLDEPTAAVYTQVSDAAEGGAPLHGKGLIIDIGAGTTDYTLVDVGAQTGMTVLDASSISAAGNYFTRRLEGLFKERQAQAAFRALVQAEPLRADRAKETVSEYYADSENRDLPFQFQIAGVGRLHSANLKAFAETARDDWALVSEAITSRLKARGLTDGDLRFVIPCGGGALHSGLMMHLQARFGDRLKQVLKPQLLVARGAALFARDRLGGGNAPAIPVSTVLEHDVAVVFPEDTGQERVCLLRKGQTIPLQRLLGGGSIVTLQSNIFLPEGVVSVEVGELRKELGLLDIPWSQSQTEFDNHPGTVAWEFRPETGELSVAVKLDNLPVNWETDEFVGMVSQIISMPGVYRAV